MNNWEPVGYAYPNIQEQTTKIIINETLLERLLKLSDYSHVVISFKCKINPEDKLLREIFGEDAREIRKVKLISVTDNVIIIEGLIQKSPDESSPTDMYDIIPYLPEYDDVPDSEHGSPGWLTATENVEYLR